MPSVCSKEIIHESCYEVAHTWSPSCIQGITDIAISASKFSLKTYTILYIVSAIAGRKGKEYIKKRLIRDILQSSLFLTCNGAFFIMFFCLFRRLYGRFSVASLGILPGFVASLASILVERKSRRATLAIYMLNQAFDTLFSILKNSGYAKDIAFGEVVIFSIAMSVMMYLYSSDNLPDGLIKNIFRKCFKDSKCSNDNDCSKTDSDSSSSKADPDDADADADAESNVTIMKNSVLLGSKVFIIGSTLHGLYYLVNSIPKLFKRPGEYFKGIARKENVQFGAWVGSFAGIYEGLVKLLGKYNKAGGHVNAAVAGGVAGASMMFQRSSTYALYIASKTLEMSYMSGIEKGILPYYKHFDSLLYACSTAIMFHAAVIQPLYLKPTYFGFLEKLTNNKFIRVNRQLLDVLGYDSSKLDRLLQSKAISTPFERL